MHMHPYIILQPYCNRPFNSNVRRPNISLRIMICINEVYWLFGVHSKIFVLNAFIIVTRNIIHNRILISKSLTNNNC